MSARPWRSGPASLLPAPTCNAITLRLSVALSHWGRGKRSAAPRSLHRTERLLSDINADTMSAGSQTWMDMGRGSLMLFQPVSAFINSSLVPVSGAA